MKLLKITILSYTLAVVCFAAGSAWAVEADPISPGSWTMILLPDTQNYCDSDSAAATYFNSQTNWIVSHKTSHNIKMVLHQGDLVNSNTSDRFTRARTAMNILRTGGVPYSIATGNHDYVNDSAWERDSLFNESAYFGEGSNYATQPHFQGAAGGFFESGKTDNSWCTFSAGGKDWIVFSTEFGPRDEVVTWMDGIAAAHPGYNFILNTHAYMFSDSTRYDWATKGTLQRWNPNDPVYDPEGSENDGQEMWDKLVKKHEGWKFTFNGHVIYDGTGWLASEGDNGNVVHQILANYQGKTNGGNGYLRIMEFMADGDTDKVSSYSPHLGEYRTAADQGFTLKMSEVSALPPIPLVRGVSAAAINVVDGTNVWTVVGSGPGAFAPLSEPNAADLSVTIGGVPVYRDQGVLMATVRQNVRGSYYGTVEVAYCNAFDMDIESEDNIVQIATSRAGGSECNMNVAAGFFPFADGWIGGHVYKTGVLFDYDYYGVTPSNVTQVGTGRYNVSINGINSLSDGMLLAVGAENGYNYISTAPKDDGSGWDVAVRDNTAASFSSMESAQWSFVYVDYDAPGLIGGRIADDGQKLKDKGSFSVSHVAGSGVYRITITGYTPADGVLLLTVAGFETDGITAPADNIISYEASGSEFVVCVRDRNGSSTPVQDGSFVFIFVPFDSQLMPAVPGDANYDGAVDEEDSAILSGHWGEGNATWAEGDFNLDGSGGPADAAIMVANWGYGTAEAQSPVPEPSTLVSLLVLSPLLLLQRPR